MDKENTGKGDNGKEKDNKSGDKIEIKEEVDEKINSMCVMMPQKNRMRGNTHLTN